MVDVQRHMEGLVRKWQEGEEDYNKSIHNLEEVLQQEKDGQRELKIQVNIAIVNRGRRGRDCMVVGFKTTME